MNDDIDCELLDAVCNVNVELVKKLLNSGANVNASFKGANKGETGVTILMYATDRDYSKNGIELINIIINAGANLNATTNRGRNALMGAALFGKFKSAKILIDAGIDLDAKDKKGRDALFYAMNPKTLIVEDAERIAQLIKKEIEMRGWKKHSLSKNPIQLNSSEISF